MIKNQVAYIVYLISNSLDADCHIFVKGILFIILTLTQYNNKDGLGGETS